MEKLKNWKKFNEAQFQKDNKIKNLFQIGHRSPNLPEKCYMTDIDALYYEYDDKHEPNLTCIVENKGYKSNDVVNFKNIRSYQRKALLDFSKNVCNKSIKLGSSLILLDKGESFEIYANENKEIEYPQPNTFKYYDIRDNVYLEIRDDKIVGVMYLKNPLGFNNTSVIKDLIKRAFQHYNIFEVDINEDRITITDTKNNKNVVIQEPTDWIKGYKELGLL